MYIQIYTFEANVSRFFYCFVPDISMPVVHSHLTHHMHRSLRLDTQICKAFDTVGKGEMAENARVVGHGPESPLFTGYIGGWDTLVINFGHHQASLLFHMTQMEFRRRVDEFFKALLLGQAKRGFKIVFWSSVPALTQRNDNIIRLRDWRTLHRWLRFCKRA